MFDFIKKVFVATNLRIKWGVCRLFPIKTNKITISSFYGRGYGDNAKYIVDELLKTNKNFKIMWIVNDEKEEQSLPEGVTGVRGGTLRSIYHLQTSKIWIDNCRKFFVKFKRKKQYYIQTWHGFALKRIEKDAVSLGAKYEKMASRDSKYIDCIISCSKFMTNLYRNSFWYDGEIKEIGAPRNDILINGNAEVKNKVFEYFNLSSEKKIVLYAPTFRADGNLDVYSVDYDTIIEACNKRFGTDFVFVTRLHPNVVAKAKNLQWSERVLNGGFYPDMQELMMASDVMITDYSSVMFDFALTNKPCFQFATDIELYKNDRNFYFELDKLPFSVAINNEQLEKDILAFDYIAYQERLAKFFEEVGMVRAGNASKICRDIIVTKCNKK